MFARPPHAGSKRTRIVASLDPALAARPKDPSPPFARADRVLARACLRGVSRRQRVSRGVDHRRPRPPHRQRLHRRLGSGPAGARGPSGGGLRLGPAPPGRDRGRGPRLRELLRLALSAAAAVLCSGAGEPALSRGVGGVDGDHAARLCRSGARHHRRAHRHRAGAGLPRRAVEHIGRPERISDRRADRRHARLPRTPAARRRCPPRPPHLQAPVRRAVSARFDDRWALAGARGGERDRSGARRRLDPRLRHRELAGVLSLDAGDQRCGVRAKAAPTS